jgi:GNAT superfamily N-acetyltransferase
MNIRRASPFDAQTLAQHRAAVWHEVGDWSAADLEPQVPVWAEFFRGCLADASYVAFIVEESGSAVASGGILVHLTIPRPGSPSDRAGRIQSVYVVPAARRRGVARAIMERLLAYAREKRLVGLTLHPSDEARHLYSGLGFEPADEMRLHFTQD